MTGWGRVAVALTALSLAAALSGCGQLFTAGGQPVTLTQLSSRVDSLDAEVGELQAAVAAGGGATSGAVANGVLQPGLTAAVVEADVLNVRSDPSLDGTVRGTLLQNAEVNVLVVQGHWSEITYTNPVNNLTLQGWVDNDYLGPLAPAPGAAAPTTAAASSTTRGAGSASGSATGQSTTGNSSPATY